MHACSHPRGATLIGILVTMVIIVVLAVIGISAMKGAIGGSGTARRTGQVMSVVDQEVQRQLGMGLITYASTHGERLPSPSRIAGDENNKDLDNSANFWSSLIAQELIHPRMLISKNEESGYVEIYSEYNVGAYQPSNGVYWDPGFKADLQKLSHTSFAHQVLYGERYRKHWHMTAPSWFPLLGTRGPVDGVPRMDSYACDRSGNWSGSFVFSDGHTEATQNPTPGGNDNYFSLESGMEGEDIIVTFTKDIWPDGFEMQFD